MHVDQLPLKSFSSRGRICSDVLFILCSFRKGSVFFVSLEPGLKGQYYYGFGSLCRLYIFKGYPQHKYNVEIIEYINILRQSTSGNPIALFRNFPNSNTENPTHFENTFRTYFHYSEQLSIIWPIFDKLTRKIHTWRP